MPDTGPRPLISVIIPTHDRAVLLTASLESLVDQTLARDEYEVVVVDDGSADNTREVCRSFEERLPVRYIRLRHAGIAAAKNAGLFAASAPLLFFFDDDDVAHADLLRQHVTAHRRWPAEAAAVLGYTTWAPWLVVTELMHWMTDVGQCLFSYPSIDASRPLDFTYFWGGRSSCKRSFLARHGAFKQDFEFGCEDIELGYRLHRFGLTVHFEPDAISFMNRGMTVAEFCRRCERQGRAQHVFSRLHRDPIVQEYCGTHDAVERWRVMEPQLPNALRRLEEFEADTREAGTLLPDDRKELHRILEFVCKAYKLKGIVERGASERGSPGLRVGASAIRTTAMPIFVLGSPRSGTTLVGLALARHSELWTSGESYFLWELFGEGRPVGRTDSRRWTPAAAAAFTAATHVSPDGWLNQTGVTWQEFIAHLGIGVNALFTRHSGGRRWIDHTPHYALMADVLAEMFPDALFLHVLRDGRSTVHSMLNFRNREGASQFVPPWATDFRDACIEWRTSVMAMLAFEAAFRDRCFTIRHEQLVEQTRVVFTDIFRFLQVPYEDGPIAYARTERLNSSFPAGRPLLSIPGDEWSRSWRELFRAEAGEAMVKAGLATAADLDHWVDQEETAAGGRAGVQARHP